VWTIEGIAAKLADMTLRVANGTRPQDIPVQNGPVTAMFDWRQLQRWDIREDRLPPGSVIRFRKLTMWEQYKWRIGSGIVVMGLQALLIGALLVERRRLAGPNLNCRKHEEHLEQLVQQRTAEALEPATKPWLPTERRVFFWPT